MPLDQTTIAFGLLILALVVLLVWIIRLELRLRRFMLGQKGISLEGALIRLIGQVKDTDRINEEIKKHLLSVEERLQRSIQHIKTIRFNPFRDQGQGSNQSSVTAFLDEHGDGALISTLYTRDKVSVYAKPIKNRESSYELTEEEKETLRK
jgi:hypothetical protein